MSTRQELRQGGVNTCETLAVSNSSGEELLPGLDNLIDEVVFGRVWSRPGLSLHDRMLATLSALTSKQYLPKLAKYVRAALHLEMSPRLIQEVMLHCSMYSGIPTALTSLAVVSDVFDEQGIAHPQAELTECSLEELQSQGEETMLALHGERALAGYAAPNSAASELYASAIQYLYGEIWNRPGIDRRQRMVCSVAAFTATQMESQQRKFFRSAQNVGLSRTEIMEIITQTGPYSGFPPALNALTIAEQVLE